MENDHKFKYYIHWGVTAFCVIAASITFGYLLVRFEQVKAFGAMLVTILMPVVYGAVLAYLLAPVYNWCVKQTVEWPEKLLKGKLKNSQQQQLRLRLESLGRLLGTLVSLTILVLIVAGLISMLLPQLVESVQSVIDSLPGNVNNFVIWIQKLLDDNPDIMNTILYYMDEIVDWAKNFGKDVLAPNLDKIIGSLSSGMFSVITWLKNILIGMIVMIYLLNMKDKLASITKKCIYALFPVNWANYIIDEARSAHQVFGGFIIGKLLDSLIIGILCFFCMNLMRMPYVLLVSVIIGVTNIIPFFGPFIGAVPSALLILLVNPLQCIYFLIFIMLLQQFDGNILGPKILGNSTGLSSFWVLFSILLFGGLFGFVGMIIGVPTFAVIYKLISDAVRVSLRKKKLPEQTAEYQKGCYVDEEKLEIRLKEKKKLKKTKGQPQAVKVQKEKPEEKINSK